MARRDPRAGLLGRRSECEALDLLLARVRDGRSAVLVLRGEAGIGKTELLKYLVGRASGWRVARASGVKSEMELAYASLQQLCAPMLDHLDRLPGPQGDALGTAFGLREGDAPDRFLVGLAVLTLLANVAEERPLVCVVDDAQWLDSVSSQILGFVARRLLAEKIGFVFAVREPSSMQYLAGLEELQVRGLVNDDARELLASAISGPLDHEVRERIVAETHGNPLALLELPRGRSAVELAFGFETPDTMPLVTRIEQDYLRRLEPLPPQTRQLLLMAAAEPVGDTTLLWRAADVLGIHVDAAPAKAAGLIEFGATVRFRHPLVRSAVYRSASPGDRQDVHRALGQATDPETDPDRRAWHRAQACAGPDEAVARELEQSADRAQARGGVAAAAAFLERATELTPDPARRGARALAAAQAKFDAAAPDAAYELLAMAELAPLDDLRRALLARLRAQIVFARRRGSDAPPLLLDAAKRLEQLDGWLAREAYLEAFGAAIFAGRLGGRHGVREVAEAARAAPPGPQPPRLIDVLIDGLATRFTEGYVAGEPPLRRALHAFRREAGRGEDDITRWRWLAWIVAGDLWDDETWHELATGAVRLARESGALTVLPVVLEYRAAVHVYAGEFAAAAALIEEAHTITEATGNARLWYISLLLVAWRGEETQTLTLVEAGAQDATARSEGRVVGFARYVTAVLYNGLGRYQAALASAQQACEYEDLAFFGFSLVELVEAGARSGALDVAAAALQRLEERTRASGTDWALGVLARSRALVSDGQAADSLYREAIERLERSRIVVHLARAHLLYGEWLRREKRRRQAREHLSIAYELFSPMGAEAFAERARRELRATGQTVRSRTTEPRKGLTAQESQIARLAGGGLTNPEIGAQLFISPHTVEWHLRKVFTKLNITSRRQLSAVLSDAGKASELS